MMNKNTFFYYIGLAVAIVSASLSVMGLFFDSLYQETNSLILTGWWINDWVTLLVSVPLLMIAIYFTKKEMLTGYALLTGLMMYTVYNYSFYLFGAAFNVAFLGYFLVFDLGVIGLMIGGTTLYTKLDTKHMPSKLVKKTVSIYMVFAAIFLSIGWIGQWYAFVSTGTIPALMEQLGATNHLVAALDMTFVVPWFLLGAILLWKEKMIGLIIAYVINVKTMIYNIILLWGSISQMELGIDGAAELIPLWSFYLVGSTLAIIFLFKPLVLKRQKILVKCMNK